MKLPLSWLNEYVKVDDLDPRELAEKLTRAGLQVESIETVGGEELSELIVVVEVLECVKHPDSDHLHVCQVTDGAERYQVVCGAPNMRQGIKTAFAKIGALIPEGGFKIKKGKLRGVLSNGMCCSEKELHIGTGADGIIEYPADTPNGALVRDVAKLPKPETVFDVEVTWNRPDALSVVGLAREFAAILGRELRLPAVDFVETETPVANEVSVEVRDCAKCPRYTARVVTDMTPDAPSPEFMVKRLEACGVRSLGLAVDVTNYVMLELGQPLHAFDHTQLAGRAIVVRNAGPGEQIVTLDGVERKLDESMLVIADASRPNAVAGIMGGERSGIAPGTRTVMIESALFEPASIKATASKLGLSSESSYRYIRGVDKDLADFASRRAAHLLQRYANAKIARGVIDVDNRPQPLNPDVQLDFGRARRLIGIDIANERMVEILSSLGLVPRAAGDYAALPAVAFGVPSWRWDLSLEADLVEEVARMYGLDNIPDTMPAAPSVSALDQRPFDARVRVGEICRALGFTEAMHYSFLSRRELDEFEPHPVKTRLELPDPVSAEYSCMRDSLLPQLYASIGRNTARQIDEVLLYEIGKVFFAGEAGAKPAEAERLALGFAGPVGRGALAKRAAVGEEEAVMWMKGAVQEIVLRLHAGKLEFKPAERHAFASGAALSVVLNGREIGVLGAVSSQLRHPYRLNSQMVLCELEVRPLLKRFDAAGRVSPVPQFPLVRRDVALLAAPSVSHADIVETIRRNGGKELVRVELFDVFRPKGGQESRRSLAYTLEFRSAERTLTDEQVGVMFQRVLDALKAMDGVEVREK